MKRNIFDILLLISLLASALSLYLLAIGSFYDRLIDVNGNPVHYKVNSK